MCVTTQDDSSPFLHGILDMTADFLQSSRIDQWALEQEEEEEGEEGGRKSRQKSRDEDDQVKS